MDEKETRSPWNKSRTSEKVPLDVDNVQISTTMNIYLFISLLAHRKA